MRYRNILATRRCGIALLLLFTTHLRADHYVAQNGQTPRPDLRYSSLDTAASNIQEAVSVAYSGSNVWVDTGEYFAMPGSNKVVLITNSVFLRGVGANPSNVIINGGAANRGVYVNLTVPGLLVRMEGLTITNCMVDNDNGGGIYLKHNEILSGTAVVQNCVIAGNHSVTGNVNSRCGGGLFSYGQNGSSFFTLLSNCVFFGNSASNGGAAQLQYALQEIVDCRFESNTASAGGGGVRLFADVVFQNCAFLSNTCNVVGGGALYPYSQRTVLTGCRFEGNEACFAGAHGGAIYTRTHLFLTNCVFVNNRANAANGFGGAIYANDTVPYLAMYNCLVASNVSDNGNAAALYGKNKTTGTYVIVNSTIVSNSGGVAILGSTESPEVEIRNSIVYDNARGGVVYNYSLTGDGLRRFHQSATLPYPSSYDGGGNTTNDPMFTAFDAGNYRLQPGSPCINTGTNQDWMVDALDLDQRPRKDRFTGQVDMGCYEYISRGMVFLTY